MATERDLFANFERMRRDMEELFPRRSGGFSPAVDVFYVGDPPRAVVQAELPGVDPADVDVEVQGRELVLTGERRAPDAAGRLYQQVEIEHGPFRRVIPLGAEVDPEAARASYDGGVLRVELPLVERREGPRQVPVDAPEERA